MFVRIYFADWTGGKMTTMELSWPATIALIGSVAIAAGTLVKIFGKNGKNKNTSNIDDSDYREKYEVIVQTVGILKTNQDNIKERIDSLLTDFNKRLDRQEQKMDELYKLLVGWIKSQS